MNNCCRYYELSIDSLPTSVAYICITYHPLLPVRIHQTRRHITNAASVPSSSASSASAR